MKLTRDDADNLAVACVTWLIWTVLPWVIVIMGALVVIALVIASFRNLERNRR